MNFEEFREKCPAVGSRATGNHLCTIQNKLYWCQVSLCPLWYALERAILFPVRPEPDEPDMCNPEAMEKSFSVANADLPLDKEKPTLKCPCGCACFLQEIQSGLFSCDICENLWRNKTLKALRSIRLAREKVHFQEREIWRAEKIRLRHEVEERTRCNTTLEVENSDLKAQCAAVADQREINRQLAGLVKKLQTGE